MPRRTERPSENDGYEKQKVLIALALYGKWPPRTQQLQPLWERGLFGKRSDVEVLDDFAACKWCRSEHRVPLPVLQEVDELAEGGIVVIQSERSRRRCCFERVRLECLLEGEYHQFGPGCDATL